MYRKINPDGLDLPALYDEIYAQISSDILSVRVSIVTIVHIQSVQKQKLSTYGDAR
jgi:hypothetical protein